MALSPKDIQFAQSAIRCAVFVGSMCPNVTDDSRPMHAALAPEERDALLKAMSNDGVVTTDELKTFEKFGNADKMKEIGAYIGNTARSLYGAASRLCDARSFVDWHNQRKSGWVTLDYRSEDERAEREGYRMLLQMEEAGVDIYPALRKMIWDRKGGASLPYVLSHLGFSSISLSEARELATLIREKLPEVERSYGPLSQPVRDLKTALAKLAA